MNTDNKLERSNLQAFCRTCLQRLEESVKTTATSIRETPHLMKLLMLCTAININEEADDVYPQLLCSKCYNTLQEFQLFREMALQSNEIIKAVIESEDGELIKLQKKYTVDTKSEVPTDEMTIDEFKAEEPELTTSFCIYHVNEVDDSQSISGVDESTELDVSNGGDAMFEKDTTSASAMKRKRKAENNDTEMQTQKEKENASINNNVLLLKEDINSLKNIAAQQTLLLEKIFSKLSPVSKNFKIFPLKTLEEVKNVDSVAKNISDENLIAYVRSIIGNTPISKCFHLLFADEALREINWDGRQNKFPIKSINFFGKVMFYATNGPEIGFAEFEKQMKIGFRSSKNKLYRENFLKKGQK